ATPEQGTYDSNTNIWVVGTMPAAGPDGEARLRILGRVPGGGVNTTPAIADGNDPDPNPLNNSSGPLPPSTGPVDLAASLVMTGDLTAAASPVNYTMGIANAGTGASVGAIELELQLPPNVTITTSPAGWTCQQVAQVYTCSRSD